MLRIRPKSLWSGAPTVCMHTVSGSISLPSRGSFRLSLTVLVHYRSITSIWPWRMGPPSSGRISRVPRYFADAYYHRIPSAYGTTTPYGAPFHVLELSLALSRQGCCGFARRYYRILG